MTVGSSYTVTVGAGGASGQSNAVKGSNGGNSVFGTITALGGGGGGAYTDNGLGLNGGSGGGGGDDSFAGGSATQGSSGGYPGYGYPGGASASTTWGSGGGGGAGGAGSAGVAGTVVSGGPGLVYNISGSNVEYGRGGNGNSDGGTITATPANVGQGAMGTGAPNASPYSGGSGIVIVRCK